MSSDSNKLSQATAECSTKEHDDNTNENGMRWSTAYEVVLKVYRIPLAPYTHDELDDGAIMPTETETEKDSNPNLLTIIISNTSQFPAQKASCNLTFRKKGEDKDAIVKIECVESVVRGITSDVLFTLSSQTQIIEKLKLVPSELAQFPSPGTGKPLQTEHSFDMYLMK
ncbi:3735_t:CDS:2 [Dentiscutata erythropus]|uniref:3735_t:CDS:1 n=1 Tax=Dentiscutata erythropus TaxID=1348616 RepID=A0A9N9G9I8_9GLOM|nr:3735_t:CDS:2 [Dentiscutata erythropus]